MLAKNLPMLNIETRISRRERGVVTYVTKAALFSICDAAARSAKSAGRLRIKGRIMRMNRLEIRLNDEELLKLKSEAQACKMMLARYVRISILDKAPTLVPALNIEALYQLKKIGNNLNQIAYHSNMSEAANINDVKKAISDLRLALIESRS